MPQRRLYSLRTWNNVTNCLQQSTSICPPLPHYTTSTPAIVYFTSRVYVRKTSPEIHRTRTLAQTPSYTHLNLGLTLPLNYYKEYEWADLAPNSRFRKSPKPQKPNSEIDTCPSARLALSHAMCSVSIYRTMAFSAGPLAEGGDPPVYSCIIRPSELLQPARLM
jgi:hypothetical protein